MLPELFVVKSFVLFVLEGVEFELVVAVKGEVDEKSLALEPTIFKRILSLATIYMMPVTFAQYSNSRNLAKENI